MSPAPTPPVSPAGVYRVRLIPQRHPHDAFEVYVNATSHREAAENAARVRSLDAASVTRCGEVFLIDPFYKAYVYDSSDEWHIPRLVDSASAEVSSPTAQFYRVILNRPGWWLDEVYVQAKDARESIEIAVRTRTMLQIPEKLEFVDGWFVIDVEHRASAVVVTHGDMLRDLGVLGVSS